MAMAMNGTIRPVMFVSAGIVSIVRRFILITETGILKRAIQKAIDGGFRHEYNPKEELTVEAVYYYFGDDHGDLAVNNLIWRHDFAMALWGNPGKNRYGDLVRAWGKEDWQNPLFEWQYHLMMMVISEDPIQYLAEHMPEDK